jgi:hypothetical protein
MDDVKKWAEAVDAVAEARERMLADPPVTSEPVWWTTGAPLRATKENSYKCQNWITARAKLGGDPKRLDLLLDPRTFEQVKYYLEDKNE